MNIIDFLKQPPELAGSICVNDKIKTGTFKARWNRYSNSLTYQYYTEAGNKGTGGFTLRYAYNLLQSGRLSLVASQTLIN